MRRWTLLVYKIPNEPSAKRVAIWRKLKRLGAILVHDGAWVLPATDATREQFQWLASEIIEMDGQASVWESHMLGDAQEKEIITVLTRQVDAVYRDILAELNKRAVDINAVSLRYQQARKQDFFNSPVGQQVRKALLAAREALQ